MKKRNNILCTAAGVVVAAAAAGVIVMKGNSSGGGMQGGMGGPGGDGQTPPDSNAPDGGTGDRWYAENFRFYHHPRCRHRRQLVRLRRGQGITQRSKFQHKISPAPEPTATGAGLIMV